MFWMGLFAVGTMGGGDNGLGGLVATFGLLGAEVIVC